MLTNWFEIKLLHDDPEELFDFTEDEPELLPKLWDTYNELTHALASAAVEEVMKTETMSFPILKVPIDWGSK